ncbi:hypothetical protein B0J13DRAFT_444961, partial [Dactylonectria estremocensis]
YSMKIRFITLGDEKIDWVGDEIKCGNLTIIATEAPRPIGYQALKQEGGQIRRLEEEDEPSIYDILLKIPWSRIEDRHSESTLGYSFL